MTFLCNPFLQSRVDILEVMTKDLSALETLLDRSSGDFVVANFGDLRNAFA